MMSCIDVICRVLLGQYWETEIFLVETSVVKWMDPKWQYCTGRESLFLSLLLQVAKMLGHTARQKYLLGDIKSRHGGRVTSLGPNSLPILACRDLYPNGINFIGRHNWGRRQTAATGFLIAPYATSLFSTSFWCHGRLTSPLPSCLVLTVLAAVGPLLLLPTAQAGWGNIPNLSQQEVLPDQMCPPVLAW